MRNHHFSKAWLEAATAARFFQVYIKGGRRGFGWRHTGTRWAHCWRSGWWQAMKQWKGLQNSNTILPGFGGVQSPTWPSPTTNPLSTYLADWRLRNWMTAISAYLSVFTLQSLLILPHLSQWQNQQIDVISTKLEFEMPTSCLYWRSKDVNI